MKKICIFISDLIDDKAAMWVNIPNVLNGLFAIPGIWLKGDPTYIKFRVLSFFVIFSMWMLLLIYAFTYKKLNKMKNEYYENKWRPLS